MKFDPDFEGIEASSKSQVR